MLMIIRGREKKPEGVVSVTRARIPVTHDADVTSLTVFGHFRRHCGWQAKMGQLGDGLAGPSGQVAALAAK